MLTDPLDEGFLGYAFLVLLWIINLAVIGLLAYGLLYLIDTAWMPIHNGEGVVINKWFSPAHSVTTYVMSGKIMIPITNFYSDTWYISISVNGISDKVSITYSYFNVVRINDHLNVSYSFGRIWHTINIKSIN